MAESNDSDKLASWAGRGLFTAVLIAVFVFFYWLL